MKNLFLISSFALTFLACGNDSINASLDSFLVNKVENKPSNSNNNNFIGDIINGYVNGGVRYCVPDYMKQYADILKSYINQGYEIKQDDDGCFVMVQKVDSSLVNVLPVDSTVENPNISVPDFDWQNGFVCSPDKKEILKGESAVWKVTYGSAVLSELLNAHYSWEFKNENTSAYYEGDAWGYVTPAVVFLNSGIYTASVTVKIGDASTEVSCDSIRVSGAPITDCVCESSTDTRLGFVTAYWAVNRCKSEANITGFIWKPDDLEDFYSEDNKARFSFGLSEGYVTPVVYVLNDDFTVLEVECPEVYSKGFSTY